MAALNNNLESLRAWWQNASPLTRASATGVALMVVIGMIVATSMATSPDYQPIFHGVDGKNASEIETVLREHNITMRFSDKDGTVSVPSKDESNATMYVEAAGILSKNADIVGIESLDKIGLGTSTDVERKRILAADQGELARKLMQLDPVATAAVTISPGNSASLFGSDVPASASVILGLKQGSSLNSNQVKGIVYLVAHAVTGLTPQNVTLTDQTGTPLWRDNGLGSNALGDGQPTDENAKYAESVRLKVQGMLDSTLGPRKAIVSVNAELDFDDTRTHAVTHTPISGMRTGLPVSVHERAETYSGAGMPNNAGVAGSGSNLSAPSYATGGSSSSTGKYDNTDTTTNYENDVQDTVVQKAPGSIKQISVAALVDTSVATTDIPKIKDVIATTIGAVPGMAARFVTVQQMTFDNSAQKAQASQMSALMSQQTTNNIIRTLAVCIVVCVLLYLLFRSNGRQVAEPRLALAGGGSHIGILENGTDEELENLLEERPLRVEDVLAEMPEVMPRRPKRRMTAPSIEEHQDMKMESIQDMVSNNTESVALLLKGWMAEEARL